MKSILSRRPSPALVVAMVALFVALGGSSYAAIKVGTKQISNNSVRTADLRNNDIRSKDIRNGAIVSKDINKKTRAALKGQKGAAGAPGAPGSALAYALVNADGTVNAAKSKNVTNANVTKGGTGVYCFNGINPAPNNVVAQLAFDSAGVTGLGGGTRAFVTDAGTCPGAEQAAVFVDENEGAAGGEDHAIMVVFN